MAAANIRYLLAATTWHDYRHPFGFSLAQTVASVEQAVAFQLRGLGLMPDGPAGAAVARRRRRGA